MAFKFVCPNCRKELNIQPEWEGIECSCPQCLKLIVPKPPQAATPGKQQPKPSAIPVQPGQPMQAGMAAQPGRPMQPGMAAQAARPMQPGMANYNNNGKSYKKLAVTSLIFSLLPLVTWIINFFGSLLSALLPFLALIAIPISILLGVLQIFSPLISIITGCIALSGMKKSGNPAGKGMAWTGVIISIINIVLSIILIILGFILGIGIGIFSEL